MDDKREREEGDESCKRGKKRKHEDSPQPLDSPEIIEIDKEETEESISPPDSPEIITLDSSDYDSDSEERMYDETSTGSLKFSCGGEKWGSTRSFKCNGDSDSTIPLTDEEDDYDAGDEEEVETDYEKSKEKLDNVLGIGNEIGVGETEETGTTVIVTATDTEEDDTRWNVTSNQLMFEEEEISQSILNQNGINEEAMEKMAHEIIEDVLKGFSINGA